MTILAIETSCDDTCAAILRIKNSKLEILSNVISSQVKLHARYGGVYPFLAKREHQKNLPVVLKKALNKAGNPKIDLIAVTIGPGLEPCLWMGVNFAKDLARGRDLPVIPVNHIEAHIFANFLPKIGKVSNFKFLISKNVFPAVCLVVSGGHTQLILIKKIKDRPFTIHYKILGETRDDAAGECFDKVARILGLGYPGGPLISRMAKSSAGREVSPTRLPRPMIHQKNYDFSFSGLKTAVLYHFQSQLPRIRKSKKYIQQICREVQQAIIDVLICKTLKAARDYQAKTIMLGGGVAANNELRKQFQSIISNRQLKMILLPEKGFCTDNAAMVALAAYYHWLRDEAKNWQNIEAKANLRLK